MYVKNYIKEPDRQLNDTDHYRKLQKVPTTTKMKLVNDTIERFQSKN